MPRPQRIRRFSTACLVATGLLLGAGRAAEAATINIGIDVLPRGSLNLLGGFYDGSPSMGGYSGRRLNLTVPEFIFTIPVPSLAGTLTAFELFVDWRAGSSTSLLEAFLWDTTLGFVSIGTLTPTAQPVTMVPVETGPVGTHVVTPYLDDTDNTLFLFLSPNPFVNEILGGGLTVKLLRLNASARIDGVNLQLAVRNDQPAVDEPASLVLFAFALIASASYMRRRVPVRTE